MEITREKHQQYMVKLTPVLIAAIVIQSIIYYHFFPHDLAHDITIFLATGLTLILLFFTAHNHFHQVNLKENYLEIKISPLKYQEEILYRNITSYEIIPSRNGSSNVRLHVRDGRNFMIFYMDDAESFISQLKKKQAR